MNQSDLDELEYLCSKLSPGDWEEGMAHWGPLIVRPRMSADGAGSKNVAVATIHDNNERQFIIKARNMIPGLIRHIRGKALPIIEKP